MSAVTHIERVLMGHCLSLPAYILSDLAQIVDAARREGAEQMREACECLVRPVEARESEDHRIAEDHELADAIHATPLPTGPRQVVQLTDEEALSALPDCHGQSLGKTWLLSAARAIETAVLAANGLETK
jgi:hypothetical protein